MGKIEKLTNIELKVENSEFKLIMTGNTRDEVVITSGVILKTINIPDPSIPTNISHVDLEYGIEEDISVYIPDLEKGNFLMYHDLNSGNSAKLTFHSNVKKLGWDLQCVGGSDIRDSRTTHNKRIRVGLGEKGIYLRLINNDTKPPELIVIKSWEKN